MKKIVTNFFWSLIAFFGISFALIGSPRSTVSPAFVGDKEVIGIRNNKLESPLVFNNFNVPSGNVKLSLNIIDNNLELYTTEVYEIKSNNFVQLVGEPFLGYVFSYWSLDGVKVSENIVYEFLMINKDISVSAHYVKINPPTVQITSPIENSVHSTSDIIGINIEAGSTLGKIEKVQLFINENLVYTFYELPYKYNLEKYLEGKYTLKAIATDNTGQFSTSKITTFSIAKANVAPTVSITGPAANAQFTQGDNISITANAADTDGTIAKVDFFNGSTLLGTDTTSPYSFAWANLPLGSFTLTARATDDKGTATVSAPVGINVKEKVSTTIPIEVVIPEVIIVTPINNQEFDANVSVELMVMFQGSAGSVKKVEYYSGSQLIGFSTISPFGFTWQTPASAQHTITAKAIGEDPNKFKISESVSILVKEKIQKIFQIIDPIKDAVFNAGESIIIRVAIPDNSNPITRVDYFRGNIRIGSSTSAPYDYTWKNIQQGNHNLSAQLIYVDGTKVPSISVPIQVLKTNTGTVKLVSSSNKREVQSGESLDLNVELLEFGNKVKFVEYILDGKVLGTSEKEPYGFQWKNIPEGDHLLIARAVEARGSSVYSEPIILSVRKDINTIQLEYVIGPNPTTDYLNVIFTNLDGIYDFEFRVVSMDGTVKKTFQARPEDSTVTVDVSDLINGVYILQLTANGNNISSKKFIKK